MVEVSLVGKRIKVFFDDGDRVVYKQGVLRCINENCVELLVNGIDLEIINFSRVIRIEGIDDKNEN